MGEWQEIWQTDGAKRLWDVPDRGVEDVVLAWQKEADVRRVLDLGCGIGRHTELLCRSGLDTFGADHSEAALGTCRERLAAQGLNATLWQGDMEAIPYADGYFDAILAFNVIYHGTLDQIQSVAAVMRAKLRPGGRCFVTLPSRDNRMYGRGDAVEPHTFLSPGMFPHLFKNDGEAGIPHHFFSEREAQETLDGFEIDRMVHEEFELSLARAGSFQPLRVPQAWFWRISAHRI